MFLPVVAISIAVVAMMRKTDTPPAAESPQPTAVVSTEQSVQDNNQTVEGSVTITGSTLASLEGVFPRLANVSGAIFVYNNAALTTMEDAFPSLNSVQGVCIYGNAALSFRRRPRRLQGSAQPAPGLALVAATTGLGGSRPYQPRGAQTPPAPSPPGSPPSFISRSSGSLVT